MLKPTVKSQTAQTENGKNPDQNEKFTQQHQVSFEKLNERTLLEGDSQSHKTLPNISIIIHVHRKSPLPKWRHRFYSKPQ